MSTFPLAYTKNWLSQFGLHKYESPENGKNIAGKNFAWIYLIIGGISLAAFATVLTFIHVNGSVLEIFSENIHVTEPGSDLNQISDQIDQYSSVTTDNNSRNITKIKDLYHSDQIIYPTVRLPSNHKPYTNHQPLPDLLSTLKSSIILRNGELNETTDYLLEREDPQLITGSLNPEQPSEILRKVKRRRKSQHRNQLDGSHLIPHTFYGQIPRPPQFRDDKILKRKYADDNNFYDEDLPPRPFNHLTDGPPPVKFHNHYQGSTGGVKNIQDILKLTDEPEHRDAKENMLVTEKRGIQISGRYRHAKGRNMRKLLHEFAKNQKESQQSTPSKEEHRYVDPFYTYKPQSPSDINLLAPNEFRFAPPLIPSQHSNIKFPESNDAESVYHKLITANNDREKLEDADNARKDKKPFSLMLDIYPMPEQDEQQKSTRSPHKLRQPFRKPFMPPAVGVYPHNTFPYSYQLDNSYYNTLKFPQLQQNRHPLTHQMFLNLQHQSGADGMEVYNRRFKTAGPLDNKPSQIMVQLNLFPKKKQRQPKSREVGYDISSPSAYEAEKRESKIIGSYSPKTLSDEDTTNNFQRSFNIASENDFSQGYNYTQADLGKVENSSLTELFPNPLSSIKPSTYEPEHQIIQKTEDVFLSASSVNRENSKQKYFSPRKENSSLQANTTAEQNHKGFKISASDDIIKFNIADAVDIEN